MTNQKLSQEIVDSLRKKGYYIAKPYSADDLALTYSFEPVSVMFDVLDELIWRSDPKLDSPGARDE